MVRHESWHARLGLETMKLLYDCLLEIPSRRTHRHRSTEPTEAKAKAAAVVFDGTSRGYGLQMGCFWGAVIKHEGSGSVAVCAAGKVCVAHRPADG
jgi:hypothetical protein